MSSIEQKVNKEMEAESNSKIIISDVQRIEIVENFKCAIDGCDSLSDIESYVIDNVRDCTDLENFLPREIYDIDNLEEFDLDDQIFKILEPVLPIWENNLNEVFAKYKDLKVTNYVDNFTFDTKENIQNWYDQISEEVGCNPEEEDEEDMDDEESASWNIYDQFIVAQVKFDFNKRINEYILNLKTPQVLNHEEDLKVKKEAEMEEKLKAEMADLLAKYKQVEHELKILQEKKNKLHD